MNLFERLTEYGQSDAYPFHMPGHKRCQGREGAIDAFGIDITEISGFDNLHHPEGIIQEEQEFTAQLYGAKKSFFLVNGSTCGVLAAISGCTSCGGTLLLNRNAHKSAYNAAYLRQLHLSYLYTKELPLGIPMPVSVMEVTRALAENDRIEAILITSPTYEGFTADIAGIAQVAHARKIPVIVDEAHGAHLGFHSAFPKSALEQGADVVIQSMHKTLPSLTQTALLHLGKDAEMYLDEEKMKHFLGIYETSSPSYVFMGTMAKCIHELAEDAQHQTTAFDRFYRRLYKFYGNCEDLQIIKVFYTEDKNWDPSKILIYSTLEDETGERLFEILRDTYHLEFEMASLGYVLGIASVWDSDQGFERLSQALHEMDMLRIRDIGGTVKGQGSVSKQVHKSTMPNIPEVCYKISETIDIKEKQSIALEESNGLISGEYIYCYPPGAPIVVPGERMTEEIIGYIKQCQTEGLHVQGPQDYTLQQIKVVHE